MKRKTKNEVLKGEGGEVGSVCNGRMCGRLEKDQQSKRTIKVRLESKTGKRNLFVRVDATGSCVD